MNVVLYLRYSSDKQTEQSIEGQQRICKAYCEDNGFTIVGEYIDRAASAAKDIDKRHEFARMMKDSEKGLWEGVIVYKLDRFSRNRYDSATYKARLRKKGVRVISATENISDNPEGIILESVLEGMAEFYSAELSQKVTRGRYETALKGQVLGGTTPLGLRVENKKYVIDDKTAPIVKEAFDLYANGYSIKEICSKFNNAGYRTVRGKLFNKNSFRQMFSNVKYIGTYSYKDIDIPGAIPAIVDETIFSKVQKQLKENGLAPGAKKARVDYLLSLKLFCGHCGALMAGESGTGKQGKTYNYYKCSTAKRHGTCKKKALPKEYAERVVVEETVKIITPETIENLADMAVLQMERDISTNSLIPAFQGEIRDIERSINNLLAMIEKGVQSDTLVERINHLEGEKKAVEARLANAKNDVVMLDKDQIVWWLSKFCDGDSSSELFQRHIIDLLVNSVTVWDDPDGDCYKFQIVYNLSPSQARMFKCSDLAPSGAPLEYYPNFSVVEGFLIYATKHCRGK